MRSLGGSWRSVSVQVRVGYVIRVTIRSDPFMFASISQVGRPTKIHRLVASTNKFTDHELHKTISEWTKGKGDMSEQIRGIKEKWEHFHALRKEHNAIADSVTKCKLEFPLESPLADEKYASVVTRIGEVVSNIIILQACSADVKKKSVQFLLSRTQGMLKEFMIKPSAAVVKYSQQAAVGRKSS